MRTVVQLHKGEVFIFLTNARWIKNFLDHLQTIGYIQFTCNPFQFEVNVSYIFVDEKYRGNGLSRQLIQSMINYCQHQMLKNDVARYNIYLDDMSDHFGKPNNIYKKMGFEYCEVDENGPCGPEMVLTIVNKTTQMQEPIQKIPSESNIIKDTEDHEEKEQLEIKKQMELIKLEQRKLEKQMHEVELKKIEKKKRQQQEAKLKEQERLYQERLQTEQRIREQQLYCNQQQLMQNGNDSEESNRTESHRTESDDSLSSEEESEVFQTKYQYPINQNSYYPLGYRNYTLPSYHEPMQDLESEPVQEKPSEIEPEIKKVDRQIERRKDKATRKMEEELRIQKEQEQREQHEAKLREQERQRQIELEMEQIRQETERMRQQEMDKDKEMNRRRELDRKLKEYELLEWEREMEIQKNKSQTINESSDEFTKFYDVNPWNNIL